MLHITISDFVHHNLSAHCVLLAVHDVESMLRNGVKLASVERIDCIIGLGRCSDMADGCCHLTHNLYTVDSEVLALDVEFVGTDFSYKLFCKLHIKHCLAGSEVGAIKNVVQLGVVGAELYLCVALSGVVDAQEVAFLYASLGKERTGYLYSWVPVAYCRGVSSNVATTVFSAGCGASDVSSTLSRLTSSPLCTRIPFDLIALSVSVVMV